MEPEDDTRVDESTGLGRVSDQVLQYLRAHWELVTCTVVGVALLSVAAYVLVRDGGDTALAALIVAGSALVILGAVGHRITLIKYREFEVRLLEAAASEAPENPEGAELLMNAAAGFAAEGGTERHPSESESLLRLEANLPDGVRLERDLRVGEISVDGQLVRGDRRVWVEVFVGSPLISRAARKLTSALAAADPKPDGILVIASAAGNRIDSKLTERVGVPVKVLKDTGPAYQYEDFVRRLFDRV
jgi:hypothetical protein